MIKDFIIIGAGISGLNIARRIKDLNLGSVLVVEKSRGVGGRMATRRTLDSRFDHGAQFYRLKADIKELHQFWQKKGIGHEWFVSSRGDHWCSGSGMTSFAKSMAEGLEISLESEIQKIDFEDKLWKLTSSKNEDLICQNLIISSPVPQTAKLLHGLIDERSLAKIKKINYTKALVALLSLEEDLMINDDGYIEFNSGHFFSISDQRKKGVSDIPAITIVMSADFSEQMFELTDELILEKILKHFISDFPNAKIKGKELKKWRYCQPQIQFQDLFLEIVPNLYLIGDAFGGSSLIGAIRSSEALSSFLIERNK